MTAESEPGDSSGLDKLFWQNTPMSPFSNQNADVKWIRIEPDELKNFPINHSKYINNRFISAQYEQYNHLVAGKFHAGNEFKYIIGVPDIYSPDSEELAIGLGFSRFKSCGSEMDVQDTLNSGDYGYWLLII